jgi:hypothetical protein
VNCPERVIVTEVGPRDGLQNEAEPIPLERKIELVDRLSATGLTRIEAASFVSPKAIPQMANAADVMAGIKRQPGVTYIALVPNERGAHDALAERADEISVVVSASDSHNRSNVNAVADRKACVDRRLCRGGVPWWLRGDVVWLSVRRPWPEERFGLPASTAMRALTRSLSVTRSGSGTRLRCPTWSLL